MGSHNRGLVLEIGDYEMIGIGNNKIVGMDKTEFWQKVFFLVVDKFVIGGFIALSVILIQCSQAERDRRAEQRERIRDVTLATSQVLTEIVEYHRKTIFTSVTDLLTLLNEYDGIGQVTDASGRKRLQDITENIENAANHLARVNPDLTQLTNQFVSHTRSLRSDLVNKQRRKDDFQADMKTVLESYTHLLPELRKTSVLATVQDRRSVTEILSGPGLPAN